MKYENLGICGIGCICIGVLIYGLTIVLMYIFNIEILYIANPLGIFFLVGLLFIIVGAFISLVWSLGLLKKVVVRI